MAEAKDRYREKMMVALSPVVAAIGLTSIKLRGLLVWILGIWSKLLTQAWHSRSFDESGGVHLRSHCYPHCIIRLRNAWKLALPFSVLLIGGVALWPGQDPVSVC